MAKNRREDGLCLADHGSRAPKGKKTMKEMGLYSLVRSTRWFVTGFPADSYGHILAASEHWSRGQIEEFRNEKLRKLITHCYENVPYYRGTMEERKLAPQDIQRAEDLIKLPVLTKDAIRTYSRELLAKNISTMTVTWPKTGGTTGEPIQVCKNIECRAWSSMCYERGLKWGGLKVDEPRVKLFGGTLGIGNTRLIDRLGNLFRRDLFLPAFELRNETALNYFDKIRRSKCRFLIGYASAIYRLAVLAKENNQEIEFTSVFPTAELMLPEWEEMIRKTFKCSVLPYYGCGEVNSLGFSDPGSGYLIPEEHALIEVAQADGGTHLYGEGTFLVTDLDSYAMPIIRYANGDAGKISPSNGHRPFSRIERLDGRYNSLLMTDKGDLISGVIGTHVFRLTSSVETYRIIQEEPLRLVIKIVPRTELSERDQHLILDLYSKYLGNRMKITIEIVPNLPPPPSGKSVFVINRCLQ
jgi:phenylacetate-CoA ligase